MLLQLHFTALLKLFLGRTRNNIQTRNNEIRQEDNDFSLHIIIVI